jgi:hypothetical protein
MEQLDQDLINDILNSDSEEDTNFDNAFERIESLRDTERTVSSEGIESLRDTGSMLAVGIELPQNIQPEKIMLNIGGQMFNLRVDQLHLFKITYDKHKSDTPFIDRDPKYFIKVIDTISKYGIDQISAGVETYGAQFTNELCKYGFLDVDFKPKPKIVLTKNVSFADSNETRKIVIAQSPNGSDKKIFQTLKSTLAKSDYFEELLDQSDIVLPSASVTADSFRYVLHLLRDGELFYLTPEILTAIEFLKIDYKLSIPQKIHETFVVVPEILQLEHASLIETIDLEMCQTIFTKSLLNFGQELTFDLDSMANCLITDIVVCMDLPVLKISDPMEYVDNMPYILIESIKLLVNGKPHNQILGNYLFYEKLMSNSQQNICDKYKILHMGKLLDVNRIFAPTHIISTPIDNRNLKLNVKLAAVEKFVKNCNANTKLISLLNIFLIVKIKYQPGLSISKLKPFHRVHLIVKEISSAEEYFNTCNIELGSHQFVNIVDFYFSLHSKESTTNGMFDFYRNELIEFKILSHGQIICQTDTISNKYFYKHKSIPNGIYYQYFCPQGIPAKTLDLQLDIYTKKIEGYVLCYVREAI